MPIRKKLIEVALPLEAINVASAREKSIRHGHPSTLHLWWARRPLAACRAVLFTQLVDDPSAWPDQFPTDEAQERERQRLFGLITDLVQWDNSNREPVINAARVEIARSLARGRQAEVTADDQDEAVLRVPPAYGADGQYRNLSKPEVLAINRYLAEVAPPVHDPFAGGGSIPLEAQRLGLRAIATDLNPVAVLINKAQIEIPPKFAGMAPVNPESRRKAGLESWKGAQGLAEDVRYYGTWMRDEAVKRIGNLYPDVRLPDDQGGGSATVIAWLWARTVPSPDPGFAGVQVPLVSNFFLATKPGKVSWIEPQVVGRDYTFHIRHGAPADPDTVSEGTRLTRGAFRCLLSGAPITTDYIRSQGALGNLAARPLALVAEGNRRRVYLPPSCPTIWGTDGASVPERPMGEVPERLTGGTCYGYGLTTFGKLFTDRQIIVLSTLSELVGEVRERLASNSSSRPQGTAAVGAYADAVATYLGLAVDRLANYHSTLCTWHSGVKYETITSTFGRQALPMTWDYAEGNPFSSSSGCWESQVASIAANLEHLPQDGPVGRAEQADAASPRPFIVEGVVGSTDPPYYDNIAYADLSDFFYVWMRRSLRSVYPDLFRTMLVPKEDELVASAYRHGGRVEAERFFLRGMTRALEQLRILCSDDAPLALYYAFRQSETGDEGTASTGWETFLEGVQTAGFSTCGTWPLRTEYTGNLKKNVNALASSVALICRKRPDDAPTIDRATFRRLLRQELPAALRLLQHGNIAPVDLAQASIGPGMAIFSRHARILEADGTAMPVRTALQLINQALDEYLTEQEGEFDPDTRFAITWFETRQFETGAFGEAETLATARNVSVSGVAEAGIVSAAAGKVRLIKRDELSEDWDPTTDKRLTIWEATQHLIKRLDKGEPAAAALLASLGSRAAPARDLAYRLYTTCERKGWAEEARAYNGLVVSWPELEKLAAQVGRSAKPQMDLL